MAKLIGMDFAWVAGNDGFDFYRWGGKVGRVFRSGANRWSWSLCGGSSAHESAEAYESAETARCACEAYVRARVGDVPGTDPQALVNVLGRE